MKLNPFGAVVSLWAIGALVLSACGSDNNAAGKSSTSAASVSCGGKKTLKASGSTAQDNAMTRFIKAFEQSCSGQSLNYTANGSGDGIREFIAKQTDFGGSDSELLPPEYDAAQRRCNSPAWDLPVVFGPIAISYNLKGVDALILDGPTAAKIFNGAITSWNDPAITGLNPGAALPAETIRVIFRSDESGTSDNFQKYLDTVADGAWGKGAGKTFKGGVGEGAMGNDGTAAAVKRTEGSISYNEWSFAAEQHLGIARIITSAGPEPVAITAESVGKTIESAYVIKDGYDLALDTISFYRPNEKGAYPIVLATYEIVCSKYPDPQVGTAVRAFLQSTIGPGQSGLVEHGYIPVPDTFRSRLQAAVNAIS